MYEYRNENNRRNSIDTCNDLFDRLEALMLAIWLLLLAVEIWAVKKMEEDR